MAKRTRIGLVRDEVFLDHEAPGYHPERPERLTSIWRAVDGWAAGQEVVTFPARAATTAELERAHEGRFVRRALDVLGRGSGYFDPDTYFSPGSLAAALGAAGGCIDAANAVRRGELDVAFGLHRPPGHHATRGASMGFCIFNNIAITAAALRAEGVERILIFDFDVHHGNGTQDIFWSDPHVLFVSFHLWPHYPGSGLCEETGLGEGAGYTVNVPFPHGTGNAEYRLGVDRLVDPLADRFRPEVVLVSAGYDGHREDPLGGLALDEDGFRMLGARLRRIADRHAGGRLMFFLEGGYNLDALASSVVATLEGATGGEGGESGEGEAEMQPRALQMLARTLDAVRGKWGGL
ncbi:MAG: histone deacetylase [Deltaproteobacteria bacterium]|nr:histone deacetylase [Deltaproteobacteria bacterium]